MPAAGGVQRAFGTDAKSLQVGFAVDAGIRAARLAAAGATADPSALDAWFALVGGDPARLDLARLDPPAWIQPAPTWPARRSPAAWPSRSTRAATRCSGRSARSPNWPSGWHRPRDVRRIELRTPAGTVVPLIHHRPETGLEGKFSLEYAAAAALLDRYPGFASFTDEAVRRQDARRLVGLVETELDPGRGLAARRRAGRPRCTTGRGRAAGPAQFPPGRPARRLGGSSCSAKLADCVDGLDTDPASWTWQNAAGLLRRALPAPA